MAMPLKKSDRKYTWEDYKTWPAGERWEIIEGMPYSLSPAPDMVIEVLSPATRLKDKREKKLLYERFGVREYCLINPDEEIVERYHLAGSRYEAADIINWDEPLTFNIFPELTVNLWEIFEKPLSSEELQERKG